MVSGWCTGGCHGMVSGWYNRGGARGCHGVDSIMKGELEDVMEW